MGSLLPRLSLPQIVLISGFMVKILAPHLEDPDFYWHIKTGEYLLSAWPPPRSDVFAYTHAGNEWVLSEWIAQIVLYLVFKATSFKGTAVFVAGMCALAGWITYLACRRHVENPVHALAVALACGLFFVDAAPRPHLFTFVFFAATLFVLLEFKYFRRDGFLYLLPAIMLVWANAHGGYFLGLVLTLGFTGCEWLRNRLRADDAIDTGRLRKLSTWAAVALVATLANPQFIGYWWYPVEAILLSGDTRTINEWQSPSFHAPLNQAFLALVMVFFAAQAFTRRRPDLTEVAIPMVFIAGAFVSMRNMPLAAMAMAPFLAMSIGRGLRGATTPANGGHGALLDGGINGSASTAVSAPLSAGSERLLNWLLLFAASLAVAVLYPSQSQKQARTVATYLPVAAADFLIANDIRGRMFNAYQYGGYLIYRLYPSQKVFVYGRTDIYHDGFIRTLDTIYHGQPKWKDLFDSYDVDYVVCETSAPIRQLLLSGGTFRLAFDDGNHSVLLRADKFKEVVASYGR